MFLMIHLSHKSLKLFLNQIDANPAEVTTRYNGCFAADGSTVA